MKRAHTDRAYNLWVLVKPSKELEGQWVAHCLDVDVVSQGNSPVHAIKMAAEATSLVIRDDLAHDFEPIDRRAPKEYWDELWAAYRHAEELPGLKGLDRRKNVDGVVVHMVLLVPVDRSPKRRTAARPPRFDATVVKAECHAGC